MSGFCPELPLDQHKNSRSDQPQRKSELHHDALCLLSIAGQIQTDWDRITRESLEKAKSRLDLPPAYRQAISRVEAEFNRLAKPVDARLGPWQIGIFHFDPIAIPWTAKPAITIRDLYGWMN